MAKYTRLLPNSSITWQWTGLDESRRRKKETIELHLHKLCMAVPTPLGSRPYTKAMGLQTMAENGTRRTMVEMGRTYR